MHVDLDALKRYGKMRTKHQIPWMVAGGIYQK